MASQTFSIKLTANGKEVVELQNALKQQANEYEKQLDQINEKLKQRDKLTEEEIKMLERESNSLTAKIKALGTAVEENITNLRKVEDVLKNLAGSSSGELGKALRGIGQQFKRVSDQTLKSGETMEQKLTEIKEKMMEVRHEMTRREGIDAMKRAQASITDLANTPLDKLKMGLDSIEKKLSTMSAAEKQVANGLSLLEGRARYRAQIAVTEQGLAGNADLSKMNADQLRQEQQRLRSAYLATDGAKGFEAVSQDYLTRLQAVNQALKELGSIDVRKTIDGLSDPAARTNLEQMEAALKKLKEQAGKTDQDDDNAFRQYVSDVQQLEQAIDDVKAKMQGINDLDYDHLNDVPTDKLEAAMKRLEEQERKLVGTDTAGAERIAENKRKVQAQIERNKRAVQDYVNAEKVAANTGKHNVTELKQAYDTLQQKLMGLNTGRKKEIEETRRQMKKLKAAIDETTGSIAKQNSVWSTAVKNITAYVGVFGAFNFVKNKLTEVIRGSAELSDQMAQVRMVSGLAMEDIEELTRRLAKMDTRTTLQELERISYAGAKLGFGEKGIQGLEEFTRAANQVNVALREDLGEEALTALSKITENMGLIKKMGVEDAMLATSSAMFKLAATSTAAAGPIVEVTKRLAPVAQMSGFATHEILALASASDSLQLMPEVVGTALSKLIMAMQNNHNLIEKYLTIPEGTIASMFKAGQSMDALMLVFDKMSGKNVTELDGLWKLLGSDGQRLITVVADMANHTDTLAKHLDTSTKAFKEATAVTEEYNIQQETAMAYLLRAENLWRNAFINPDSSLSVKEMTKAWYDFTKSILSSDVAMGSIKLSVDALLLSLRLLIALLPAITFGLIAKGFAMLIDKLKLAKLATDGFAISWKKMDAATKSNWIGLIVGSLVQAVYWTKEWISSTSDAEKEQKKLSAAIENMHEKQEQEIGNLNRLKKQLDDTNISQEVRNALLSKVRSDYDIYLNYLGIEKDAVADLTSYYDALVKVMKQRFAYQEREEYKRDIMGGEEGLRMQRRKAGSALSKAGNGQGVNVDLDLIQQYVKEGKNAAQIYAAMFPDVKAAENEALQSRPSGPETYATPGAAATAANDYDHSFANFRKSLEGYVDALQQEINKETEINAAFASEIGDFDYDKWLRTQVTGDFKVKPDKTELAAARKAMQDEKQALRKELQDAKTESDAIIAKIEEWYRLQETVITDMQADGKLTKEQADQAVRTLNIAKNTALRDARLAISGRDTKAWEVTKKQIGNLMLDQGEWSQELLQQIMEVSMDAIRRNLSRIDKGGGKYGITTSSLKDAVDKNAAGNQREIARLMARSQQEVEKILMEYDFFEQAMQGFSNRLAQMGILSETARQMAERLADASNPDTLFSMKDYNDLLKGNEDAKQQMLQAFIRSGAQPYGVNPEDKDQLRTWFMEFVGQFIQKEGASPFGENMPNVEYEYLSWAKPFEQDFEMWLRDSDKYLSSIQSFYFSLMKSEEDYYENRKQSYNHYKKQLDQQDMAAGIPTQREDKERQLQTQATLQENGIGASFWRQQGLGGILNDPEVMLIQQRIEWRNQDLESAKALLAGKEALWEKEKAQRLAAGESEAVIEADLAQRRMGFEDIIKERQTALFEQQMNFTTKIAQEMRKRVQTVNQLTKPIQDGAENIGQKFGEMLRGIEEQSMTWKEIWHSMAVAVGESVIDMTAQYAQNLIMEKAMNAQSKQEAIDKATVDVAAGTASGAAKTIGTLGWWGIALVPVIAALLRGLLHAAFAANKSSDNEASSSTPKMKLVSGMLTYDNGTGIPASSVRRGSAASSPVLGDDGRVYHARTAAALPEGVHMLTQPVATMVNGQPGLVAERGPEIVIGRRTTRRLMMNQPGLLRALATIDAGHTARRLRTYDEGTGITQITPNTPTSQTDQPPELYQTLDALSQTVTILSQTLNSLQQKGIPAHINKYGAGGLIDEVQSGLKFVNRYK